MIGSGIIGSIEVQATSRRCLVLRRWRPTRAARWLARLSMQSWHKRPNALPVPRRRRSVRPILETGPVQPQRWHTPRLCLRAPLPSCWLI